MVIYYFIIAQENFCIPNENDISTDNQSPDQTLIIQDSLQQHRGRPEQSTNNQELQAALADIQTNIINY